jgi:hypothetical protein
MIAMPTVIVAWRSRPRWWTVSPDERDWRATRYRYSQNTAAMANPTVQTQFNVAIQAGYPAPEEAA